MTTVIKITDKLRSGRGRSMDYNRVYGKFQVRYPDGLLSQRFCHDVAKSYQKIFGGTVISVREEKHGQSKDS
jgi:hypothetical protein